jgi:hypothetical protein
MRKYGLVVGLAVATLMVAVLFIHFRAFAQATSGDPIFGTWKMDLSKSVNNRAGDHEPYPVVHTRILAPDGDGLRNTLITDPAKPPAYSYSAKLDGREYPDPLPRGEKKTLTHWRLGPDMIVRLEKANGKPAEWAIYTVSSDGNVFTSTSWAPEHPELQDVQVFTRAK